MEKDTSSPMATDDDFTRRCLMIASIISFETWHKHDHNVIMQDAVDAVMMIERVVYASW